MEEIDYKKRCEEYEKRMGIGENDPAKEAYLVLVKLLRQQTKYLENFELTKHIGGKPSEDGTFVRTQSLWEKLPDLISRISGLKNELKMDGDKNEKRTEGPISPQSVALNGRK